MRSITRMVVGSLIAIPLTVGAAGMALADDYSASSATAGPNGTYADRVISAVDDEGNAFYLRQQVATGPGGASSNTVGAYAGDDHPHHHNHHNDYDDEDYDGDEGYDGGDQGAAFLWSSNVAGPNGASSAEIASSAGDWGN